MLQFKGQQDKTLPERGQDCAEDLKMNGKQQQKQILKEGIKEKKGFFLFFFNNLYCRNVVFFKTEY